MRTRYLPGFVSPPGHVSKQEGISAQDSQQQSPRPAFTASPSQMTNSSSEIRLSSPHNIKKPGETPTVQEKIIIDPDHRVRHDILTRSHIHSRGVVSFKETADMDGRTILTIDFRDPLDAGHFRSWLNTADGIVRR
jgi:hypothetical protein